MGEVERVVGSHASPSRPSGKYSMKVKMLARLEIQV
jgi:hypothetical protein